MGTMRPNKYDVTTSNLLCQDFVPPDGGCCGSIMQQRPNLSLFEMCQQICWNNSRWKAISIRQHWFRSPTRDHNYIASYGLFSTRWFRQPHLQINTFLREKSNLLVFHKEVASCYNGLVSVARTNGTTAETSLRDKRIISLASENKNLHESCYFYETLENGWFQYRSAMNEKIFLGFTKNGRPVRQKAPHLNTDCYNFQKMDLVQNKTVKHEVKSHKTQPNRRNRKGPAKIHPTEQRPNVRRRHGSHTKRLTNSNSNINVKESDLQSITDYTYDDYLNMAKKQKAIPKKVSNINSGVSPKFRHAQHRRNNRGGKVQ